jgi:hypothetical protein
LKPFFGEYFAGFLQELIKLPKTFTGIHVTLRQLTPDTTDFRPLLKEIKRSGTVSGNGKEQTNCFSNSQNSRPPSDISRFVAKKIIKSFNTKVQDIMKKCLCFPIKLEI